MKKRILLAMSMLAVSLTGFAKVWTITAGVSDFTFTPATITISEGDSVQFTLASIHSAIEVNLATWNANGNTPDTTGFNLPLGGGMVLPIDLDLGVHYFVCGPHASSGMKGRIFVVNSTGIYEPLLPVISLYPNPTKEKIRVTRRPGTLDQPFVLRDLTGKTVLTGMLTKELAEINIRELNNGIYLLQVGEARNQIYKVVKD